MFEPLPTTPGGFAAIVADPPWSFKTWSGKTGTPHRTAEDHYSTMTVKDMYHLPVADVAAKDTALFMWTLGSHIDVSIELAKAWGFSFKTDVFIWDKDSIGLGYWSRKQAEQCFLFTRGKPIRKGKGVRQIIRAPRREHSRKPDELFKRVETLVDGPYLELFARNHRPGWTVWGNQTNKFEVV